MDKVRQYFENTSLHGPKYITEFGRHYVEKFLWILVFTAASTLGVYLTVRIVNKWNQTPTLTSISTTNFPLNKIPFPAVTICPNTKGLRGKIVNEICRQSWTDHMDPDLVLLGLYNAISPMLGPENEYENDSTENFLDLTITEVISVLKRVSPKCSDYLLHCTWNSVKYNCSELFKVTSTDVGFCCSFNLVPPNQILSNIGNSDNLDDDFDDDDEDDEEDEDDYGGENYNYEDTTVEDYAALYSSCDHWLTHLLLNGTKDQWEGTCDAIEAKNGSKTNKTITNVFSTKYVLGHGLDDGLSLIIDPLVCELLSTDFFDGLKVYVHNSDTFPEVGQRGFIVDKATVNYVALNAYVTESSMDIKRYSNTTRLCNFPDERQLKYYKNYTRANCELEAKIDNFKTKCGCKPYYFPGDFVICDKEGMKCIRQNQNVNTSNSCLPLCTEVSYETSLTVAEFPGSESLLINSEQLKAMHQSLSKSISYDYFLQNMVILKLFFPENSAKAYQRDELYSPEDLIANIGGTLGLCLGFSLVSLVELFYFLTLRWIFDRKK